MRHMVVSVAGLGPSESRAMPSAESSGIRFGRVESVFPAVTCVAQASFRTASVPRCHGMVSNGFFDRVLRRPSFWEQSSGLVHGKRIWQDARDSGSTVGIYFWQQSLGESADYIVSPAPIHKHGGGMIMGNYTKPPEAAAAAESVCGTFPLHRYWGPLASSRIGRDVVRTVRCLVKTYARQDFVFVYLPTLDYDLQRFGPDDRRCAASVAEAESQIMDLKRIAEECGADFTVFGDYSITTACSGALMPNLCLREAGLFNVRMVRGMAYPDFYESRAFAMADHEIAHVYLRDKSDTGAVVDCFRKSGLYSDVSVNDGECDWGAASAGDVLITARQGSWCDYRWWTSRREEPDFASHVDIHNKPGYDPCELFFDRWSFPPSTCRNPGRIRGTHGRKCDVAFASTAIGAGVRSLVEAASELGKLFNRHTESRGRPSGMSEAN